MDQWYFSNDRGEAQPVGETELRSGLKAGRIDAGCLIWRVGWKDWMRAQHVRQFAKSLGARARETQDPQIDLKRKVPPPLPEPELLLERAPRFSTPIPQVHRQKPLIRRPPVPTITEDASSSASASGGTLRPPGAVPPPPRAVPRSLLGDGEDFDPANGEPTDGLRSVAPFQLLGSSQRPSTSSLRQAAARNSESLRTPPAMHHGHREDSVAEIPPEELSGPQHSGTDLPTLPYDPDSLEHRPSTPSERRPTTARARGRGWSPKSTGILIALGATSLIAGTWLTLRRPAQLSAPTPVVSAIRTTPSPVACSPTRPAQRISPNVLMSVSPIAAESAIGGRMLVGFAENSTTATGIAVDPEDLDVSFPFRETKDQRIISVAPLLLDGKPSFYALRENQALRQSRAVDASRDFLFGLSDSGFARQTIGGRVESIWTLDSKTAVTDPRLSSIAGQGHAVTFRQGGQSGSIMLGWLTNEGQASSGPFQVRTTVGLLGTPALAAGSRRTMVAFAGRMADNQPWSILISVAAIGTPPEPATEFVQPPGGQGGDSIAPALVSLPDHHWLLQWSEGPQGQRQVRIQTLNPDGRPIGLPHTLSPVGSNSGQGLLWSSGQRAVSLFVVNVGRSAELWATPISCGQ